MRVLRSRAALALLGFAATTVLSACPARSVEIILGGADASPTPSHGSSAHQKSKPSKPKDIAAPLVIEVGLESSEPARALDVAFPKSALPIKSASQESTVVREALSLLGVPYVWGGASPSGFDCSGFVQYVYRVAGRSVPRTADVQFADGYSVSDPEPGDLVFFQTYDWGASHVGIYLGNGYFINAIRPDVHISNFSSPYFRSRYLGARRFV